MKLSFGSDEPGGRDNSKWHVGVSPLSGSGSRGPPDLHREVARGDGRERTEGKTGKIR